MSLLIKSDYWISQQKHWCQYCRIYIADNKPSRTMHEQGKKHKENVEKFLRDIRRRDHENRKEDEKTKRELDRIERAAMKQYKKDIILEAPGASMATFTSKSNTKAPPGKSSLSEHDMIYASSGAESSSYIPPADSFDPTELNKKSGSGDGTEVVIGEWRPVTPPAVPQKSQVDNESKSQETIPQEDDEDEEDPDDLRNFKVVEKTFPLDNQIPEDSIKDEDSSKVTFKKRKFAGKVKTRNIRKKPS
ncbi:12851_t:CDS:2 [Funneliformis mosseae]|uniref:12851_t:CDS:1 n=1 Tax=Funneliformis mosseae TaxID=27381 RepID=A0A9N8Z985_FUNMO|nr:12851_t:CDS:2 [Funneliformis mosseae]